MAGKAKRSNVWNYFQYCQEEDRLELKLWNFSSRTSTRTEIFGTRSSRTSTRTKIFGSVVPVWNYTSKNFSSSTSSRTTVPKL